VRILIVTFDPPENVGGVEGRAAAHTQGLVKENNFVDLIALAPHYDYSQTSFHGGHPPEVPVFLEACFQVIQVSHRQVETEEGGQQRL